MATRDFAQRIPSRGTDSSPLSAASGVSLAARRHGYGAGLWMAVDAFLVLLSAFIALHIRATEFSGLVLHGVLVRPIMVVYLAWFAGCVLFLTRTYGGYAPLQNRSSLNEARITLQAVCLSGLSLAGLLYITRGAEVSRAVVVESVAITGIALVARRIVWRISVYKQYERGLETRNVIIVGSGRVGQLLRAHIEHHPHLGYTFKGFVHAPGTDSDAQAPGVLGGIEDVLQIARAHFVDDIMLSGPCERGFVKRLVAAAAGAGVDVRVIPELYDGLAWNVPIEYVGQFPTIPLHRRHMPVAGMMVKRAIDMVLSAAALLVLGPIMTVIAIAVKLDSKGPIFYGAERIGKKGRVFCCWKFRTMVPDADRRRAELIALNERDGVLFKMVNDPRITRVGRILRKYSLDELPQFWNVLRGDMSLVGPRPPIAGEVEQYELSHLRRLDVMPGITGLWQVQARQDPSFDSYISLDTAYIENWSIWLDFKIMVRTVWVMAAGGGA